MSEAEEFQIGQTMEHIEHVLGRSLRRVDQKSGLGASHDFETDDGSGPRIAFEHKQVAPAQMLRNCAAIQRFPGADSSVLRLRWEFAIDMPTLEVGLQDNTRAVMIKGLPGKLEPHLLVLEQNNVHDAGQFPSGEEVRFARYSIRKLVGSLGRGEEPIGDETPGVWFRASWGHTSPLSTDAVGDKVQSWLDDSEWSANLVDSLSNADADERHAVLVFTADYGSMLNYQHLDDVTPNRQLRLPENVDCVWLYMKELMARSFVLRYQENEWSALNPIL